jgi:alkylation response protein AidB-like acyl-CoA dehydrogenase
MNTSALVTARELSPLIASLREKTEASRNIAMPIVDRLRDGGLCRLAVAKELAGLETPIDAALDVYETLAYADASVGWVAWNNSLPCFLARFLSPAARAELFADPQWLYACSTRPTGRAKVAGDGYRISGRWGIVSGCELAEWILLLCVVEDSDGEARILARGVPELRFAFVRRADCKILDTWHVGGLRGTGSHDVVVESVLVPRASTLFVAEPSTLDGPLGRLPIICSMAAAYGAQALGVAQSAIDTLIELTTTKAPPEGAPLRERPTVLADIGRQGAALEAARAYLHTCAERSWRTAVDGGPPALDEITALWGAGLHAAEMAEAAVDAAYAAGGINSLYTSCPLERAHRDMHAMRRHIVGQALWLEDAGRVRLGAAPVHPLYAV